MKNGRKKSNSTIFNFWTNRVPHRVGRICWADKNINFHKLGKLLENVEKYDMGFKINASFKVDALKGEKRKEQIKFHDF